MLIKDDIRSMISQNKTEVVLNVLRKQTQGTDVHNQLTLLLAKWNSIKREEIVGIIDRRDAMQFYMQVNNSVLEILHHIEEPPGKTNTVFISYNHQDSKIAQRLKTLLLKRDVNVVIDSDDMRPGEDIKAFIDKSIRESAATLSIVSNNSLLSAWVAMESVGTYNAERLDECKKFIACYLEDDFFKRDFTDTALDNIDDQILNLQKSIGQRLERNRNIRDLQDELERLSDLRHNLDGIVTRLRGSKCIDIRASRLKANFNQLVDEIIGSGKGTE